MKTEQRDRNNCRNMKRGSAGRAQGPEESTAVQSHVPPGTDSLFARWLATNCTVVWPAESDLRSSSPSSSTLAASLAQPDVGSMPSKPMRPCSDCAGANRPGQHVKASDEQPPKTEYAPFSACATAQNADTVHAPPTLLLGLTLQLDLLQQRSVEMTTMFCDPRRVGRFGEPT